MMKRVTFAVIGAVFASSASAQMVGIGRVGGLGGVYDAEAELSGTSGSGSTDSTEPSFGLLTGYTMALESIFFDLGLEYQTVNGDGDSADFDRTDVLLSVGTFLPRDFSVSAGYRFGWQGDGFLDDDFYRETGPFVGVGFPTFPVFADWEMSTSAAVNFTELDLPGVSQDIDFFGLSGRAAVSKPGLPHTFGLRVQRFNGDVREGGTKLELTETYAHLFYQFNFFPMGR